MCLKGHGHCAGSKPPAYQTQRMAGRKHIHMDYAIIGLSDMDQAPKWLAKLETALMVPLMYPLITGQGGGPMKTGCLFLTFLFFCI